MRLLLEGPAIEPLLARVRDEHGPTARIVNAERVRSGGVGGFFAKEHFEVTVELDDPSPASRDRAELPAAPPSASPTSSPPARDQAELLGLDALVAAVEQAEREELPAHRPLSTESTAFDQVLKSLQTASAPADEPAIRTRPEPVPFTPRSISRDDGRSAPSAASPSAVETASGREALPEEPLGFHVRLSAAGLPRELVDALGPDAGPPQLLAVLRGLPTAPALPTQAGRLVVVVGERREATGTARRVADRLRLNREGEGFATPASTDEARRVSAGVRVGMVPGVVVVECGLERQSVERTGEMLRALSPDQVIACVDATRKTADTRAWLDGWRHPGVRVDALSVHDAAATSDPATVLGLGSPVSEVDGLPGSATTWLALLLDRIER